MSGSGLDSPLERSDSRSWFDSPLESLCFCFLELVFRCMTMVSWSWVMWERLRYQYPHGAVNESKLVLYDVNDVILGMLRVRTQNYF